MTAENRDLLVAWLNDAHAMEKSLIPILENHAEDLEDHPQLASRVRRHRDETERHAERVKECLARLGEEPSGSKSMMGKVFGNMQAPATGPFDDEIVKNALMDFATENFEIASYSALAEAARRMGENEIARTCEEICEEEEQMADWLEENLPNAVGRFVRQPA